jgi:hypothetical protein
MQFAVGGGAALLVEVVVAVEVVAVEVVAVVVVDG